MGIIDKHVVPADGRESEILVGRGIAKMSNLLPITPGKVAFMTQPAVASIAGMLAEQTPAETYVRELPDGEAAKRLSVVEEVYEWLNDVGFTRGDVIVGVGGGALTDVAGFVAATYLRGVEVVYLPTTLLGAADASIGGKTGVNVGGKNLAGVFRHPQRVIVDFDILDGNPTHLRVEGSAEVLKAGLIADPTIVTAYEKSGAGVALEEVLPAAIAVKVDAVTDDFREQGRRAILNYGHTVGHAVEVAGGIPHGHAVAIGMVAAGRISEAMLGFEGATRQREVIQQIGLPVAAPPVERSLVDTLMMRDKKRDDRGLRMVLLEEVGKPVVRHVPADLLQAGMDAIGVLAS
jgi:3-dehydroquinate synthase